MRKLKAITLAISFACIFFAAGIDAFARLDSERWTSLQEGLSINTKSLFRQADNTVSLWVKIVPAEGSAFMYDARTHLMEDGKDHQAYQFDYTGFLSEIDCSKKRHRELVTIMYDANKNIIHAVEDSTAAWDNITPGSSFDLVQRAVCN